MSLPELGRYLAETYGIRRAVTIGLDYAAGRTSWMARRPQCCLLQASSSSGSSGYGGNADFGPIISQIPSEDDVNDHRRSLGADSVRFMQTSHRLWLKSKVKIMRSRSLRVDDIGMDTLGTAADGIYVYQ